MTELTLAQTPSNGQLAPSVESIQPPALVTRTAATFDAREALMPRSYEEVGYLAKLFSNAGMYAADNKPMTVPQCAVVIMTGIDLGLTPSQAMRGISVIKGKPSPSADLLVACVRRRKDICDHIQVIESSATGVKMSGRRVGDLTPTLVSFTIEDAQKAELTSSHMYKKYPEQMLYARCAVKLIRRVWSDVALGLYTPDELRDGQVDPEGNLVPVQPATPEPVRQITHEPPCLPDTPTARSNPDPPTDQQPSSLKTLRKILNDRIAALDADQKELIKQYASTKFNGKFMPAFFTEEQSADVAGALDAIANDPFMGLADLLTTNEAEQTEGHGDS